MSDSKRSLSVHIQGFLGIREAFIPIPAEKPLTVTGPNASGKTSVATALAGIMCRTTNPLGLATRKVYTRDADEFGEVSLKDADGTEMVRWVPGEQTIRVFTEAPEKSSIHAMSLVDFVARSSPSARQKLWEDVFLPDPAALAGELQKVMQDSVPREAQVHEVMETLRKHGWIVAEQTYGEHAKNAKREWQAVTGENWGVKKGQHWRPTGWLARHEGMTHLDAQSDLETAREAQRALQVSHAVTEAQKAKAKEAIAELEPARQKFAEVSNAYGKALVESTAASDKFADLRNRGLSSRAAFDRHMANKPVAGEEAEHNCPYSDCGRPIFQMPDGSLATADRKDVHESKMAAWESGLKRLNDELDSLRGLAKRAQSEMKAEADKVKRHEIALADQRAKVALLREQIKEGQGEVVDPEMDARIASAEQKVSDAETDLRLVEKQGKAAAAHGSVLEYGAITTALGPRGVRARAINDALATVHEVLVTMTERSGWPEVELDKSYAVHIGGRPAALCSESEKWRAQFLIQCALASLQGDKYVIADGADILDTSNMCQLIGLCEWLVSKAEIIPLICMTYDWDDQDLLPEEWPSVKLSHD